MGLLKHVILPFYAVVMLGIAFQCLVKEDLDQLLDLWGRDVEAYPLTNFERHLVHVLGATCLVFSINSAAAVVVENSHYRGMVVFLITVFFCVDLWSYISLGARVEPSLCAVVAVGFISLLIHAREPGIFTKDKEAEKAKTG